MRRTICAAMGFWLAAAGLALADQAAPGVETAQTTAQSAPQATSQATDQSIALTGTPVTAAVAENPVVVELYTSQGCSSCPPADGLLAELAGHDGVIALALHVDYWDYIGWKDGFGAPAYTARQKAYARAAGSRMIYTPQIIVEGRERIEGFRPIQVADVIASHRARPGPVKVTLHRQGNRLSIHAGAERPFSPAAMVQLVRYLPERQVTIGRGENAGRTLDYHNIVTSWQKIATWDGHAPLALEHEVTGSEPVVVIIQARGPGPILGAAQLAQ